MTDSNLEHSQKVLEFTRSQPNADVIYGGWDFVNHDGSFQKRMTLFPFQKNLLLRVGCYIGSTSTFYRRKTIIDEGYFLNVDFRYVMDGEYYARLANIGKRFVYLPSILADFRIHDNNLSFKNYGKLDASGWLELQKQLAEGRAYRRAYGGSFFKDDNLNAFIDFFPYIYFRTLKLVLKRIYRRKTDSP